MVKSLFRRDAEAIISAWTDGERSMEVFFKLVKPNGMLSRSHIAYLIWMNFPDDAGELVA